MSACVATIVLTFVNLLHVFPYPFYRSSSFVSSPRSVCSEPVISRKRSYPEGLDKQNKRQRADLSSWGSEDKHMSVDIGEIIRHSGEFVKSEGGGWC